MIRGFLVDTSVVLEQGAPLVRLYGRSEDGRPFLVRERRFRPYFFVPAAAAAAVSKRDLVPPARPTVLRTLQGEPVVRIDGLQPLAHAQLAESLQHKGVPCFEADLRLSGRFLIDHALRGVIGIVSAGGTFREQGALRVFEDPEVVPVRIAPPPLRTVSIDIEADARAERLLSIALCGSGPDEVLLLASPAHAHAPLDRDLVRTFASEAELLAAFCTSLCARDPDILTGWNVIDFDLAVLQKVAQRVGVPLRLGRDGSEPYLRPARSFFASSAAELTGRVVLDGIQLLRGSFVQLEEYGLDAVARHVLGTGKTLTAPHRVEEIQRVYREDPARFVEYNRNDAELVLRILDKLGLVELSVQRSLLTGMPLDQVSASIASFDSLYLPELRRRGVVAPSVHRDDVAAEPMQGGLVLEPCPGTYRNVLVFDFKSLYPSVIRTFNIDPLGQVRGPARDTDLVAPSGARFRREPAILPGILDALFPRREEAKRRGDTIASHAIKILMNSLYGVFGTPACRFFDADIANAITGFGREILCFTKARFEQAGYRVLYGDTDSLFVLAGTDDEAAAARLGDALLPELNRAISQHVSERWHVESRLELEKDTHYLRLFLPSVRSGEGGARKRYAGLVAEGGVRSVVFTGMEVVRRDSTELAKRVQRELFERLFSDRPVEDYLRETVRAVLAGAHDGLLVYRKALRKPLASYTASTPPHVAAARKLAGAHGRVISYVMTQSGPEPIEALHSPIDRRHYIDKQLRPVAEQVLDALGLDFDRVVDAPGRQLSLL
ncbi:MAG: DNA polymerase II [Polyangia bacterium]